jgi:hypothetical protein
MLGENHKYFLLLKCGGKLPVEPFIANKYVIVCNDLFYGEILHFNTKLRAVSSARLGKLLFRYRNNSKNNNVVVGVLDKLEDYFKQVMIVEDFFIRHEFTTGNKKYEREVKKMEGIADDLIKPSLVDPSYWNVDRIIDLVDLNSRLPDKRILF